MRSSSGKYGFESDHRQYFSNSDKVIQGDQLSEPGCTSWGRLAGGPDDPRWPLPGLKRQDDVWRMKSDRLVRKIDSRGDLEGPEGRFLVQEVGEQLACARTSGSSSSEPQTAS